MMTRQERAKQFMPFDAMKGLQEALKDRRERHGRVEKREISDEDKEKIGEVIVRLKKDSRIRITYYSCFHEVTKDGLVACVNTVHKYILMDDEKIFFDDIYSIRITDK